MLKSILSLLMLVWVLPLSAQDTRDYPYGLRPMALQEYLATVRSHPEKELVNLEEFIPEIVLDIRYATKNNFTGEQIYELPLAYARRPVAGALKRVQAALEKEGLGVKIFDAYRPYSATVRFYEVYPDTTYVASPYRGSRHNRGCALDLTLIHLSTGKELKMPTGYDAFTRAAWPSTHVQDPEVRKNRAKLIAVMEAHGFRVNASEWWHFDFQGWNRFEVLDIDFNEL